MALSDLFTPNSDGSAPVPIPVPKPLKTLRPKAPQRPRPEAAVASPYNPGPQIPYTPPAGPPQLGNTEQYGPPVESGEQFGPPAPAGEQFNRGVASGLRGSLGYNLLTPDVQAQADEGVGPIPGLKQPAPEGAAGVAGQLLGGAAGSGPVAFVAPEAPDIPSAIAMAAGQGVGSGSSQYAHNPNDLGAVGEAAAEGVVNGAAAGAGGMALHGLSHVLGGGVLKALAQHEPAPLVTSETAAGIVNRPRLEDAQISQQAQDYKAASDALYPAAARVREDLASGAIDQARHDDLQNQLLDNHRAVNERQWYSLPPEVRWAHATIEKDIGRTHAALNLLDMLPAGDPETEALIAHNEDRLAYLDHVRTDSMSRWGIPSVNDMPRAHTNSDLFVHPDYYLNEALGSGGPGAKPQVPTVPQPIPAPQSIGQRLGAILSDESGGINIPGGADDSELARLRQDKAHANARVQFWNAHPNSPGYQSAVADLETLNGRIAQHQDFILKYSKDPVVQRTQAIIDQATQMVQHGTPEQAAQGRQLMESARSILFDQQHLIDAGLPAGEDIHGASLPTEDAPTGDVSLGARLRAAREAKGISVAEAAGRAGVSPATWHRAEKGYMPTENPIWRRGQAVVGELPPEGAARGAVGGSGPGGPSPEGASNFEKSMAYLTAKAQAPAGVSSVHGLSREEQVARFYQATAALESGKRPDTLADLTPAEHTAFAQTREDAARALGRDRNPSNFNKTVLDYLDPNSEGGKVVMKSLVRQTLTRRSLPEALKKQLLEIIKTGNVDALERILAAAQRTSIGQAAYAAVKGGMLTNPGTLIKNVAGNAVQAASDEAARGPGALVDMAISKITGTPRHLLGPNPMAIGRATKASVTDGMEAARDVLSSGPRRDQLDKLSMARLVDTGNKWVDNIVNSPFVLMNAADRPAFEYAYQRSMDEQLALMRDAHGRGLSAQHLYPEVDLSQPAPQSLDELYRAMHARASHYGNQATYNDHNALASWLESGAEKNPFAKTLLEVAAPFRKVPLNMATEALKQCGLFQLGKLVTAAPGRVSAQTGHLGERIIKALAALSPEERRAFALNSGKMTNGWLLAAIGAHLYSKGVFTPLHSSNQGRNNLNETMGRLDSAVHTPIGWLALGGIAPALGMVALGASMADMWSHRQYSSDTSPSSMATNATSALSHFLGDNPLSQGGALVDSIFENPRAAAAKTATDIISRPIPGVVNGLSNLFDAKDREAPFKRVPGHLTDTVAGEIVRRTPARFMLPAKIDALGQDVPNPRRFSVLGANLAPDRSTPLTQYALDRSVGLPDAPTKLGPLQPTRALEEGLKRNYGSANLHGLINAVIHPEGSKAYLPAGKAAAEAAITKARNAKGKELSTKFGLSGIRIPKP